MENDTTLAPATLAALQALTYAAWFNTENGCVAEHNFELYTRPSGVVDLFVVADGSGVVSDMLFHVGYVNRRGAWVETTGGCDSVPCEYWDGPGALVTTLVVPA
jgi:hypothetical protein